MKIDVLDKGFVELISCPDDDLTVVNAARVSFGKESEWEFRDELRTKENSCGTVRPIKVPMKYLSDRDTKLIKYLAKHDHWTPFAHPQVRFRIKMPIFVARQMMRSNIGITWNEISRRYLDGDDLPLEFYEPTEWRGRPRQGIKQGSGDERIDSITIHSAVTERSGKAHPSKIVQFWNKGLAEVYRAMTSQGIAPEQARTILPQSLYTEVIATMSLMACARIVKQRTDSHAQYEIQQFAKAMDELMAPKFPVSWEALVNGV